MSSGLAVVLLALTASDARAHLASVAYSEVELSDDLTELVYRLRINSKDMAEPLGLEADSNASDAQIRGGADRAFHYLLERIEVSTGEPSCKVEPRGVEILKQTDRFALFTFAVRCQRRLSSLAIQYSLFFDIDPMHTNHLVVRVPEQKPAVALLSNGNARFVWNDFADPPPSGWWGFLRSGIDHIIYGFDHVAFLLALLLVVVIGRGSGPTWQVRGHWQAIKYTAIIVTSFTLGHSITLISASLGWQPFSSKLVESLIALSIVYVAVENIVFPAARYRFAIAAGFGLMHGLGFASMLRALLPPGDVIGPLVAFNLGVEIGQLAIVIVAVPILALVALYGGGARVYRERIMPAASILVAIAGLLWLIERLFEVSIMGGL